MSKRRGFTLVELLVVIGIISLLVSIILPSLNRAKELAKRTTCMSNLKGITQALFMYAQDRRNKNMYPHPGRQGTGWANIGYERNKNALRVDGVNQGNSRGLWLLVLREFAPPEIFICASTDHKESSLKMPGGGKAFDFEDHEHLSYSYQNQWTFSGTSKQTRLTDPGITAVVADRNPVFGSEQWSTPGANGSSATPDNAQKTANSENHRRDGQNVAFKAGNVFWARTPKVGLYGDNIWTRYNGTDWKANGDNVSVTSERTNYEDSFLVP